MISYLEDEDGVAVAALGLASARLATVVDEHATIEAVASSDGLHSVKSRSAGGGRNAATGSSVGQKGGGSSGQGSTGHAGSRRAGAGASAVAAAAVIGRRDLLVVGPLSPRVVGAAAPLPALAASVGAKGESKDCELSVLHLDCRLRSKKDCWIERD